MSNQQFTHSPINGRFIEGFRAGDDMGRFVLYIYMSLLDWDVEDSLQRSR